MKEAVLKMVRANLVELIQSGACFPEDIYRMKDRLKTLLRRYSSDVVCQRLQTELNLVVSNQACPEYILRALVEEIDEHLSTFNALEEYLKGAFCISCPCGLAEFLDAMVAQGLPVQIDPPWTSQLGYRKTVSSVVSSSNSLTLTIIDAWDPDLPTPALFEVIGSKFESVASRANVRPKIWVIPTINSGRILVALGESQDLDLLLNHIMGNLDGSHSPFPVISTAD